MLLPNSDNSISGVTFGRNCLNLALQFKCSQSALYNHARDMWRQTEYCEHEIIYRRHKGHHS